MTRLIAILLVFLSTEAVSWGQVSIVSSSAVTESFTGFNGTASPTNWTCSGSGSTGNSWNGTNQSGSGGGWYGNNNLSFLGSGNSTNGNATWTLRNNTGATITAFSLSFTAYLFKSGSASPTVTVTWQKSTSSTMPASGALTNSLTSLSFSDAIGFSPTPVSASRTQSSTCSDIKDGEYIFIRFIHSGGSNSDNLGWDDVTFTPSLPSTRYYVANNSWTSTSSWSSTSGGATGASVPTCGDNVVIEFLNSGAAYTIGNVTTTSLSSLVVNANVLVTLQSGNSAPATLTLGGASGDDYVISSGASVTLDANSANVRNVKIVMANSSTATISGTLIPQYSNGSYFSNIDITNATSFTVNSSGTVNDQFNTHCFIGNSALKLLINGTYICTQNGATIPTAAWGANSSCQVTGRTGTAINGTGQNFGNFIWNCSGHSNSTQTLASGFGCQGNFTLTDDGNQSVTFGGNVTIGGNMSIATGTSLILTSTNVTLSVSGTSSITGTLNLNSGTGSKTFTGNFTINSGGTLTEGGPCDITFGANYSNSGTFTSTNNTYNTTGNHIFTGTAASIGGSGTNTFNNVTFSGGGTKTLTAPMTVATKLTLTSGVVVTDATNILYVSATGTGAVSGSGSTTNMIDGPLKWLMATATTYVFPVGDASTYMPLTLSSVAGTSPTATVQVYSSNPGGTFSGGTVSTTEYWEIVYGGTTVTAGTVKLDRNSALGTMFAVGSASSASGTYASLGGTISGTTITATSSVGTVTGLTRYYAMISCAAPAFTTSSTDVLCNGQSTGSVAITASGGSSPYQYSKDNGSTWQSGSSFSSLSAGSYTVIVKGNDGCQSASSSVSISQPASALSTSAGADFTYCTGVTNVLDGSASGGTGSVSYSWSPGTGLSSSAIAAPTLTLSGSQTYTLTVTDANGCSSSDAVIVSYGSIGSKYWAGLGSTITGSTSGTDFNTSANWSSTSGTKTATTAPSACDNVFITTNSSVTIGLSSSATINNLTISHSGNNAVLTIKVNAQTLTINGNTSADVTSGNLGTDLRMDASTGSIIYNGNISFGQTTTYCIPFFSSTNGSGTAIVRGDVTLNAGAFVYPTLLPQKVIFDGAGNQNITTNSGNIIYLPILQIGGYSSNNPVVTIGGTYVNTIRPNDLAVYSTLVIPASGGANDYGVLRNAAGGTFNLYAGALLKLGGANLGGSVTLGANNFPANYTTITLNPTSTVEYYGATQTVYATPTYGHLTITNTGTKTLGAALTAKGSILINTGATLDASASNFNILSGLNWTNNGTFTPRSALVTMDNGGLTNLQTISGTTTFNNLTLNATGATFDFGTSTDYVAGTLTVSSGTMNGNASNFIFTGASSALAGANAKNFYNLQINNGALVTHNVAAGAGNVFVSGAYVNNGTLTQTPTLNFNMSATGGATQNMSGSGTSTFGNFIIPYSTNTVNAGSHNFTVCGTLFNAASTTGVFNGGSATVTFSGNVVIGTGTGSYNFYNVLISGTLSNTNNKTLNVSNSWTNNGTFTASAGSVVFNGSGNGIIGGSVSTSFYDLTIAKSISSAFNTLSNNITITNQLTMTSGNLDLGAYDADMGSSSLSGGTASSYVKTSGIGVLKRIVSSSSLLFPVGNSAFNPATLNNSGTSDKYSIRVIDNVTDNGTGVGTGTSKAVVNRTWMISEAAIGGSAVTARLNWNSGEGINNFNAANAFMAHYLSASALWDNIGGTIGNGYVEASGITSFSPFTVSSEGNFAPLPIELTSFQANCSEQNTVDVTWSTASEHNTNYFRVDKSRNGTQWDVLGTIGAAGNSTNVNDYVLTDAFPNPGINYYRLTQYDLDGVFATYDAQAAVCKDQQQGTALSSYPNPSSGDFNVDLQTEELEGEGVLMITDAKGAVVHSQDIKIIKGNNNFVIQKFTAEPGIYYISVKAGASTVTTKHSLR